VVNAVFRAVHSIKGGAAAFGLKALVQFAHTFENALADLRAGKLPLTEELTRLAHRSADHLSDLVRASRDGVDLEGGLGEELSRKLASLGEAEDADGTGAEADFGFVPLALPMALFDPPAPLTRTWRIRFRPGPGLLESGNDPVHLFRELARLGTLRTEIDPARLPLLEDLEPGEIDLDFTLTLETAAPEADLRDVFEFVTGLCQLEIEDLSPPAAPMQTLPATEPAPEAGDAVADFQPLPMALDLPGRAEAVPPPPAAPAAAQPAATAAATKAGATVRVDLDLVDRLINMVGELVINQSVLSQAVADAGMTSHSALMASLTDFRNLTREIQESVMAIRAQPVKPLFQRMARIVREASDIAGKSVHFVTQGDATEVDKTVIEQLVDPLTHMIRNAIDHGIEPAARRREAGKPETGVIRLSAAHRSGRVVIEVADDGGGINRPKVLEIARRRGLVPDGVEPSEAEIDNLLFLPGFSTASSVTNLSGRGVGMDVVKSAIRKLGGRVAIASTPGKGTVISISLPLTLAVLDGMVVDVAGQTMVVPITAIVETLRPAREDVHALGPEGEVVKVRDRFLPVVDLGCAFGHRARPRPAAEMVLLLVQAEGAAPRALAVDRIHDQRQVVIKGLETNYGHVPGVAAATILGDGKIALIIDPEGTAMLDAARAAPPAPRLEA
jgi:two-component system chemotaxis sensor kinase CheA